MILSRPSISPNSPSSYSRPAPPEDTSASLPLGASAIPGQLHTSPTDRG